MAAIPHPWKQGLDGQSLVGDVAVVDPRDAHYGGPVVCESIGPSDQALILAAVACRDELIAAAEVALEFMRLRVVPPLEVKWRLAQALGAARGIAPQGSVVVIETFEASKDA